MSQSSGIPLEELRPHMFLLRDRDATSHLMRYALHMLRFSGTYQGSVRCALYLTLPRCQGGPQL